MSEADIIQVPDSQPTTAAAAATGCTDSNGNSNGESNGAARRGGKVVVGGGGGWIGSTKLGRLELELREMRRKSPGAKAVVFSQVRGVRDVSCLKGDNLPGIFDGTVGSMRESVESSRAYPLELLVHQWGLLLVSCRVVFVSVRVHVLLR